MAEELPPSSVINNAFSNSYHFDAERSELLVHRTRIPKAGDFGLVMIHALSHIKVDKDNLSNDGDPRFVAEFYNNLKILSQDLFKRSAAAVVTVSTNNTVTADGVTMGGNVGDSLGPPRTVQGGLGRGASGMLARQGSMRGDNGNNNSVSAGPSMRSMLARQPSSMGASLSSVLNVGGGAGLGGQGNGSVDGSDANRSTKQQQRKSMGGSSDDFSTEGMLGRMKRYAQAAGGQVRSCAHTLNMRSYTHILATRPYNTSSLPTPYSHPHPLLPSSFNFSLLSISFLSPSQTFPRSSLIAMPSNSAPAHNKWHCQVEGTLRSKKKKQNKAEPEKIQ